MFFIKLIKIDFFIYHFLNDIKRCQEQAQTQALILEPSEAVSLLNPITLNKFVQQFWQEISQKLRDFVARLPRMIYLPIAIFMGIPSYILLFFWDDQKLRSFSSILDVL
jgi:hypothetical protein